MKFKAILMFLAVVIGSTMGLAIGATSGTISTDSKYNIVFHATAPVSQNLPSVPIAGNVTMTGPLTLSGAPTMANEAATKNYVDSLAGGLIPIDGVVAASTANLTATYVNGVAGVGATLTNTGTLVAFSIDGVTPAINSRILIKNQTAVAENGIYQLSTVGSGAVAWVLTRTTDYDTAAEIKPGTLVTVASGTVNAGASWYETSTVVVVGTDPINFSVFFSPAGYLQVANNLSDVASASSARTNLGLAIGTNVEAWGAPLDQITAGTWAGASSITTLGTIATGIWHGSVIPSLYGGSGVASPTAHGILIGEGASPFANVVLANNQFLWGATGTDPVAATFSGADGVTITPLSNSVTIGLSAVPNASLANSSVTLTSGTNISVTGSPLSLGGTATINVAAPFAATTLTSNGLLIGNGASNISAITPVNNAVVSTNGSGVPSESTTLPSGLTIPGYALSSDLSSYLSLAGGTMTGDLDMDLNNILNIAAITTVNITATGLLGLTRDNATIPYSAYIYNTDNTDPGSHAGFEAYTGGTSGGDPYYKWAIVGGGKYAMGIDNSDSGKLKITDGDDPSSGSTFFTMTNAGAVTLAGALSMGSHLINSVTDPVSAQDASTKNYTDTKLALSGGTLVGNVTNSYQYLFAPTAVVTTMSQTGILATITGGSSNYSGAYVVPATGSAFTIVTYQGTNVFPTNVSQTIAGGTSCTVYYYANGVPLDASTSAVGQISLFSNIRYLNLGGSQTYRSFYNASAQSFSTSTSLATAPNNSSNMIASQSGTTVTGVGTSFSSSYIGHMIRFATGQTGWITAVGSTTSMTVTPSQTVSSTDFDIPGKTSASEATSADAVGNFGTNNAYINNSLTLPSGYTLTTNISGNAATVTTNANLTGDVTSSGNATTYSNAVPLNKSLNANLTASNGGIFYSTASAGAILSGTATAGKVLQSGATAAPTWSTPTYPSASGSAGKIMRADGTNNIYSTSTFADTYTASNLLYSNGANTVTGLATANNGILVTDGSGVPSISSTLPSAVQANITQVGAVTATSVNGNTITAGSGTLTLGTSNNITSPALRSYSPVISDSSGHNFTMSAQNGNYIQYGNCYIVFIDAAWSSKGSATAGDNIRISLPVTAGSSPNRFAFALAGINGITATVLTAGGQANNSFLNMYNYTGTGTAQLTVAAFSASGFLQLSGDMCQ